MSNAGVVEGDAHASQRIPSRSLRLCAFSFRSLRQVKDGAFVRHVSERLRWPSDMVEWEGCWLVAERTAHRVEYVPDGDGMIERVVLIPHSELEFPNAIALVPGVGLFVRESGHGGQLQVSGVPFALVERARECVVCVLVRSVWCVRCGCLPVPCDVRVCCVSRVCRTCATQVLCLCVSLMWLHVLGRMRAVLSSA